MKTIEVEVLDYVVNAPVLELPDRRFPGVLIQGDSLANLAATAEALIAALSADQIDQAREDASELYERLMGFKRTYESAMRTAGLELPYVATEIP